MSTLTDPLLPLTSSPYRSSSSGVSHVTPALVSPYPPPPPAPPNLPPSSPERGGRERRGASLYGLAAMAAPLLLCLFSPPEGVSPKAWRLLSIFLSTIVGIVAHPLPLGAVALMGLGLCVVTKTLSFSAAFSGFVDDVPWLIAVSFFFSKGFVKTGLGNRVAFQLVSVFGNTSLGLGYSLVACETLLAPALPSITARGGGIILPLVESLSLSCGSNKGDGTERKLGAWLIITCFQSSVISSAMFLTAMAANPLAADLAYSTIGQPITWALWAGAASVPGVTSLILIPLLLYVIYPPEIKDSPDAPKMAKESLEKMGKMTSDEKIMALVLLGTVTLWISGTFLSIDVVSSAIIGLSCLLITGVVTWNDCLTESVAWDTLLWFAALISMADYLKIYGLIGWFTSTAVEMVSGVGFPWQISFLILILLYFYSHYFFASGTAHVGAMYTAFLSVLIGLGTPPLLAALSLAYLSNLMGGITHYGIGSGPAFYGANYVPLRSWWFYGFVCSVVNLLIWITVGGLWWRVIGLWE